MNVFHRSTLITFGTQHPETRQPLLAWYSMVNSQTWKGMNDVVATYSTASPINNERCAFDICGGNYRMIVAFHFRSQSVYIKFLGTHTQYDRVNAATVDEF